MNPPVDLSQFDPVTQSEREAAARAVFHVREAAEGDAVVDSLTRRELELIKAAYWAGGADAILSLRKQLGAPHAVTLDASAVRQLLLSPPGLEPIERVMPSQPHPVRLVGIVRDVNYHLSRIYGDEAGES